VEKSLAMTQAVLTATLTLIGMPAGAKRDERVEISGKLHSRREAASNIRHSRNIPSIACGDCCGCGGSF